MRRKTWLYVGSMLSAVLLASAAAAAPRFRITPTGSWPDAALDINDLGQVVGSNSIDGPAWVWQDGVTTPLPNPGGRTWALGINGGGDVVGYSGRAGMWRASDHRFVTFGVDGSAQAINDGGQSVGVMLVSGVGRSFIRERDAAPQQIPLPAQYGYNAAMDVNNEGLVVGVIQSGPAYRWDAAGGFVLLPQLLGSEAAALGVNDRGQIVGSSRGADNRRRAVLLEPDGTLRELIVSPGGYAAAREVNEAGWAVGDYEGARRGGAFLWDGGAAYELLDLVENAEGWTGLTRAWSINNRGQIVGVGFHQQLGFEGYILTPVPEPGAACACLAAAASLRPNRRRRPA